MLTNTQTSLKSEMVNSASSPPDICIPGVIFLAVIMPVEGALIWNTSFSGLALNKLRSALILSLSAFNTSNSLCASSRSRWDEIPSSNIDCTDFSLVSATLTCEVMDLLCDCSPDSSTLLNSANTWPLVTISPNEKEVLEITPLTKLTKGSTLSGLDSTIPVSGMV